MATYRNAIRSKKFIREAFQELLAEKKDLKKITVKDLIERADISKSTFYAHYIDMYAVIEEFENELINTLNDTIDDYIKSHTEDPSPYVNHLLNNLKENDSLYKMLLTDDSSYIFIDKIKKILMDRIHKDIDISKLPIDEKGKVLLINFVTNGIVYLFVDYYKGTLDVSFDELTKEVNIYINLLTKAKEILQKNIIKNDVLA